MEAMRVYGLVEKAIEIEIKELMRKLKSKRVADRGMKGQWQKDLEEISLLRKGIGQIKEGFLDRVLPY